MFKIPLLRYIFFIALLFATVFPLYDLCFIVPSYQEMLVKETERNSARFVRFLVISNDLDDFELRSGEIPDQLIDDVVQLKAEGTLEKLRIFSNSGEIVFSTNKQELGQINRKPYFRKIVAKGHNYSKMVRKESVTAEGERTDLDLVETYVPLMENGVFRGAMEVYSDVSTGQKSLTSLSRQSFIMLLSASIGLMLITVFVLYRAWINIIARDRAEAALQEAFAELENRVGQRTLELSSANQQLASEITERKKAQQAQKTAFIATSDARDRVDAIISSVADALLVTDHEDSILWINPAAEALFEVKAEKVVGQRLPEVIGYDELLLDIAKARKELVHEQSVDFDFSLSNKDAHKVFQGRASRLRDSSVNGRGLILLIHDVTRERQIDQMKSEFVSMAAHELQTPLTMILGYSELLVDPSKEFNRHEKGDFLHIINEKSIELSGLIDDILDLSRIEDGRGMNLDFKQVDIAEMSQKLFASFADNNSRHSFDISSPEGSIYVDADEDRVTQVMENLIANAVKYSPAGGVIRLVLAQEENWMSLDIADQGIGMSAEEKENAFEHFYRADSSNTAIGGTGLGLSIAKYIVDAHGGTIEIFSSKGKGTRVKVRLPLVR